MVSQIRLYNGVASKDIIRYTEENSTTNYKKILRLYSLGINKTCIVESCGCVCSAVSGYLAGRRTGAFLGKLRATA